jgi:hypothetical protein
MNSLDLIQQQLQRERSKPPIHLWQPDLSGEIDIVIRSNGDWMHEGRKIERLPLIKLFSSILRREADNHYYLVTPIEKWRIQVDQAPLLIVRADIHNQSTADQKIIFTTNVDDKVLLSKDTRLMVTADSLTGQPFPIVDLENGLSAKINRSTFYELVDCAVEREGKLYIFSDSHWFELGAAH